MEQAEVKDLVNWQYFVAATDAAVAAGRRCIAEVETAKKGKKIKEVIVHLWRAGATVRYHDRTPSTVTMDELLTVAIADVFPANMLKKRD